ncbi:glutamate receptor ionotropic, delta-1-like isoform X2 [Macrobrachium rosenbergii]|uniref:glutamate receptor ionotropic, delta-1-like isoform X2 n=1 Tax=Macrobrachium rosenbergii TaxID=79674 RepID=UPI0034D78ABF
MFVEKVPGKATYVPKGSLVDILEIIYGELGYCTEWVLGDGWQYGRQLPNKSWTGIIGQLMRGEIDASGTLLSQSPSRMSVIDFSVPLYMDTQAMIYQRPVILSDLAGFAKPYTGQVWLLLFISLIMAFLLTFVFHRYTDGFQQSKRSFSGAESVWVSAEWTIGTLLSQPCAWFPRSVAMKIVIGTWFVATFVIGSVYRGNLKAMLILPKLRLPFDNLHELIESKLPTYVPAGSALMQTIYEARADSQFYQLQQQIVHESDIAKAKKMIITGKTVAFTSQYLLAYMIHEVYALTKSCPLYMASEKFFETTSISFAFPKGSALTAKVNPMTRGIFDGVHSRANSKQSGKTKIDA